MYWVGANFPSFSKLNEPTVHLAWKRKENLQKTPTNEFLLWFNDYQTDTKTKEMNSVFTYTLSDGQ